MVPGQSSVRIGLIADTHLLARPAAATGSRHRSRLTVAGRSLPDSVRLAFQAVDLILHAGDVYDAATLDALAEIAPVLCARGSEDDSLRNDPRVRDAQRIECAGFRVGLLHAFDFPIPEWRPLDRVLEREFDGPLDVLVFGDSHVPVIEQAGSVLLVNPGSATLPGGLAGPGTIALLTLSPAGPAARIVQLER